MKPHIDFSDLFINETDDKSNESFRINRHESTFSITCAYQNKNVELEPEQLTPAHIKQVANELGLITLSWPPIDIPTFENRKKWPNSYIENSKKEKLALLFAENFRRQYINLYPNRRQLVLAVDNECGIQVS